MGVLIILPVFAAALAAWNFFFSGKWEKKPVYRIVTTNLRYYKDKLAQLHKEGYEFSHIASTHVSDMVVVFKMRRFTFKLFQKKPEHGTNI